MPRRIVKYILVASFCVLGTALQASAQPSKTVCSWSVVPPGYLPVAPIFDPLCPNAAIAPENALLIEKLSKVNLMCTWFPLPPGYIYTVYSPVERYPYTCTPPPGFLDTHWPHYTTFI